MNEILGTNTNENNDNIPTDTTVAKKKRLTLFQMASRTGVLGAISCVVTEGCSEAVEHLAKPKNVHRTKIERDSNLDKLAVQSWFEKSGISKENAVHMFIHAGGNARNNMSLATALMKEFDAQSIPANVELRIDEGFLIDACKTLQIPSMSIDDFNAAQNTAIIDCIVQKKYSQLFSILHTTQCNVRVIAQGEGNSYTEARSFAQNLPDLPDQVVIVPMYSHDTGHRSHTAMNAAWQNRVHQPQIHVLDFNEIPTMNTQEWFLDHCSWRLLQVAGVQELPKFAKRAKYDLVP
jgi:hypothetical protein